MILDSPDCEFHIAHLTRAFFRFRVHGLNFKPQKCKLFQERILFTGQYVSTKGIEINAKRTDLITDLPVPRIRNEEYNGYLKYLQHLDI